MAPVNRLLVLFAVVAAIAPAVSFAAQYIVGDDQGWRVGFDYREWAKDKKFYWGDTLVFRYKPGNHSVFQVFNTTAFENCTIPEKDKGLYSGNDYIVLSSIGVQLFVCGTSDHCKNGQKFEIFVRQNPNPVPAPPPSAAPTLCTKHPIFHVLLGITFAIVAMVMVN